jgi:hypothetical protein
MALQAVLLAPMLNGEKNRKKRIRYDENKIIILK